MYHISLIIPVYNAEKFLNKTIKSVMKQSIGFENIELILVDDNSNDGSKEIIEEYAEKYDNIVPFYSKKNHGFPGFGRNIGLKKSTAEFIMFMDNDDELDKDICKNLYNTITNENADIVCCDKINVDNISEIKHNINYFNGIKKNNCIIIENEDILKFSSISVWNKIYRKKIIDENKIRFIENTTADDFVFTLSYYLKSKKLVYLKNYFGYYWNIKSDSLSHVVTIKLMNDFLNINQIILNMLKKEQKIEFAKYVFKDNIPYLITQSSYLEVEKNEFKEILRKIHDFETEINFTFKLNSLWLNIINYLILNQKYTLAILLLRIINQLRKSYTLKKINRKL